MGWKTHETRTLLGLCTAEPRCVQRVAGTRQTCSMGFLTAHICGI